MMLSKQTSELLLRHPGLVIVETDDGVFLRGFIKSKENYYHISLDCPKFPMLKDFKLLVRDKFFVRTFTETSAAINNLWTVSELIAPINFETLLQSQDNDLYADKIEYAKLETPTRKDVNNLINENNNVAVENFYAEIASLYKPDLYEVQLNTDCTLIRLGKFLINEQHYLEIELPSLQIRAHSLPECLKLQDLIAKCEKLTTIVEKFQKFIEDLQPFYENFIAIDELCHIVQPAKPTTKHNFRLFVLREHVFLKLEISDPFAPLASMSVHIIGPTAEVEKLRRIYSEGLKDWDAELDIQKNLLRIFDLCYFPMPPDSSDDEQQEEYCNICYSYRLDASECAGGCEVPVVSCDNPQCTLIFHDTCLLKWFRTLSDNVSFLNVSFGNCPFCKARLSTSFEVLRSNYI